MICQIGNREDTVAMKLAIDRTHPDAESSVCEISSFWAGHPDAQAPVEEHLAFVNADMVTAHPPANLSDGNINL